MGCETAKPIRRLASKHAISDYWHRLHPSDGFDNVDQCWGCGAYSRKLERAHIEPKCDGGSDSPHNLHLLCPMCHHSSEALTGDVYFDWFWNGYSERHNSHIAQEMTKIRAISPTAKKFDSLSDASSEDCKTILSEVKHHYEK